MTGEGTPLAREGSQSPFSKGMLEKAWQLKNLGVDYEQHVRHHSPRCLEPVGVLYTERRLKNTFASLVKDRSTLANVKSKYMQRA